MNVEIRPGKYIAAVSGGVDSVTLLDLLSNLPDTQLVVAHFNHGIRQDAGRDEELVERLAEKYKLPFEAGHGHLGPNASEEQARAARYQFLESSKKKYMADGIITAHHQDDLIETVFINLLRGSGPKGLTAILENPKIIRPLIGATKREIAVYAKKNKLEWRDDPSNADTRYLRNYIRQNIMPNLTNSQKKILIGNIQKVAKNSQNLNQLIATTSQSIRDGDKIDRQGFINLPLEVQNELMVAWLRQYKAPDVDKRTIERLNLAIRTATVGSRHPVRKNLELVLSAKNAQFRNTV